LVCLAHRQEAYLIFERRGDETVNKDIKSVDPTTVAGFITKNWTICLWLVSMIGGIIYFYYRVDGAVKQVGTNQQNIVKIEERTTQNETDIKLLGPIIKNIDKSLGDLDRRLDRIDDRTWKNYGGPR
jgi:hypothetical protein